MFVDASAICAILLNEDDAARLMDRLTAASSPATSAISIFEAVNAICRVNTISVARGRADVEEFLRETMIRLVSIGQLETELALDAMARYGRGRHPAKLNMGDCFSYACARANGVPLLYKGDDFSQTDIQSA